ncbi:MAG: signal peptidase I [Porcipelethomonas sp.]
MSDKISSGNDSEITAQQLEAELKRVRHKKESGRLIRDTVIILVGVAAAAVLIAMLFLPVLRVTGSSMEPSLGSDDIVVCKKNSDFERGDIIAFYFNNKILLKRVIGLPGDIINISDSGEVTVNNEVISEPYVTDPSLGVCDIEFPYQVPDKRIFVMGDHRSTSVDSRSSAVGCIADEFIVGKVIFRIWPVGDFGTIG